MIPLPAGWADLRFFADDWPRIAAQLAAEPGTVLPPPPRIFAALALTPPEAVRAVILGQDPYPQPGKADGLAFSIPAAFGQRRRDSLAAILAEVSDDIGLRDDTDLSDWAGQGVLLLNTALTVPEGRAGGHARLGWDVLVREVLERVSRRPTAFLVWGAQAARFAPAIRPPGAGDHLILSAGHPSPLNTGVPFRGTRPFSAVNRWLEGRGEAPIRWT